MQTAACIGVNQALKCMVHAALPADFKPSSSNLIKYFFYYLQFLLPHFLVY